MYVKVNKGEIENLANQMDLNTSDLQAEVEGCIKDLERLREGYKSTESKMLIETMTLYFEKLKTIPYAYDELNKVIKKSGNIYKENDSAFKLELERENEEEKKKRLNENGSLY